MPKVLLGMSGGVDSSAAAIVLMKNGYEVAGCTVRMFDGTEKNISDAKAVCEKLGIEHFVFDFSDVFKEKVIGNFIDAYFMGDTPNPCVECNRYLKFGKMLEKAQELGYDCIATGHYAQIRQDNGRYILSRPKDKAKDQTYFLYNLTQHQLAHTLFPLADLDKPTIRNLAAEAGLINADKPDSQDICFVPDGDYASFIKSNTDKNIPCGNYIDSNGNILGQHSGMIHYTIGQRKGLGVTFGRPMFVVGKNAADNTVTLGGSDELFTTKLAACDVNFVGGEIPSGKIRISAKVRYSQKEQPATAEMQGDRLEVIFDEPQRAIASGQAVVLYDGDDVIGGGKIIREE